MNDQIINLRNEILSGNFKELSNQNFSSFQKIQENQKIEKLKINGKILKELEN